MREPDPLGHAQYQEKAMAKPCLWQRYKTKDYEKWAKRQYAEAQSISID